MTGADHGASSDQSARLVLVTGPSGAGRSTTLRCLEDLGYEAIDNLPLSLVPALLTQDQDRPICLGLDVRNRDFHVSKLAGMIEDLRRDRLSGLQLLYLDCRDDVLIKRFSETRRRHPLSPAEAAAQGIAREQRIVTALRPLADVVIDTSDLTPHDLRAELDRWYGDDRNTRMAVSVRSFSFKRGLPPGADMVFDCRFLRNPYWAEALRDLDGRNSEVAEYVAADPRHAEFFARVLALAEFLLPAYLGEGKSHLSLAFGCTGGQHRSVVLAERLAEKLAGSGWAVSTWHHELERRGLMQASAKAGDAA